MSQRRTSSAGDSLLGKAAIALYRGATQLAAPAIQIYLQRRKTRGKEDPLRFAERMGHAGRPRPAETLVWIHAASIGESFSVLRLIERLLDERADLKVLVTTGTVTSAALMAERLPAGAFHQYVPVDRLPWVRRFLDHWRPDLAVWVESEFWPNLTMETVARDIPMVLLNARMSPASFARWLRIKPVFQPLIAGFSLCLAQDEAEAQRLRELGARNIKTAGNLKHAASPLPVDETQLANLRAVLGSRPAWVAASTHDGEEAMAGTAHRALRPRHPGLLTIIAPRHPARAESIAEMLRSNGLNVARRSLREPITPRTDIYLADTLGELGLFYRLVPVAFVGGSLVPRGGQNVLEPARLGAAVLAGPHMENFQSIADELTAAGGMRRIEHSDILASAIGHLLDHPAARRELTDAARGLVATKDDVLERVVTEITAILPGGPGRNGGERTRLAGT